MASKKVHSTNMKGKKLNTGEGKFLKARPVADPDEEDLLGAPESPCVIRITCDENQKGGENSKKGILKHERTYSNKHVDFNMDVQLVPFDEAKDYTIEIQIVEQMPKKVVSYAALIAEQRAMEEAEKNAKEKEKNKNVNKHPLKSKKAPNKEEKNTSDVSNLSVEENSAEIKDNKEIEIKGDNVIESNKDVPEKSREVKSDLAEKQSLEVSQEVTAETREDATDELRNKNTTGEKEEVRIEQLTETSLGTICTEHIEQKTSEESKEIISKAKETGEAGGNANEKSKVEIANQTERLELEDAEKMEEDIAKEQSEKIEELPKVLLVSDINEKSTAEPTQEAQDTTKLQVTDISKGDGDMERLSDDEYQDAHSWSEEFNLENVSICPESNGKNAADSLKEENNLTGCAVNAADDENQNEVKRNILPITSENTEKSTELEKLVSPNPDSSECLNENKNGQKYPVSSSSEDPSQNTQGLASDDTPHSEKFESIPEIKISDHSEVVSTKEGTDLQNRFYGNLIHNNEEGESLECGSQSSEAVISSEDVLKMDDSETEDIAESLVDEYTDVSTNSSIHENIAQENQISSSQTEQGSGKTADCNEDLKNTEISNEQRENSKEEMRNVQSDSNSVKNEQPKKDSGEFSGELSIQESGNNEELKHGNISDKCEFVSKLRKVCEIDNQRVTERISDCLK